MKKIGLIFLALMFVCTSAQAIDKKQMLQILNQAGEPDTCIGYNTIGGTQATSLSTSRARKIVATVPAGGMTVTHWYMYSEQSAGTGKAWVELFETDGTEIFTFKGDVFHPTSEAWTGRELDSENHTYLSAGDYAIQYWFNEDADYFYDTDAGVGGAYGTVGSAMATTASSRKPSFVLCNYAAH